MILMWYLKWALKEIPRTITTVLGSLEISFGIPYVDKILELMNIGTVANKIKAYALELSLLYVTNLVATIDKLRDSLGNAAT